MQRRAIAEVEIDAPGLDQFEDLSRAVGRGPEAVARVAVRVVIRPSLKAAEATPAGGIGGAAKMEFVEALLAEDECALGAVDFKIVLRLAARGDPARFDAAGRAAGKPQKRATDVVDLDLSTAARPSERLPTTVAVSPSAGSKSHCRLTRPFSRSSWPKHLSRPERFGCWSDPRILDGL